jgi:hypothetical protein
VGKQLAQLANSTRTTGEPLASGLALTSFKKENPMNNHIFNILKAFSACAVLAVSCLCAQSDHKTITAVPFDFMVGNQHMSAGTYDITTDQSTVLVRGEDNGSATFALAFWAHADKTQDRAKLVFKRYGDRYFLSQVWYPGTNQGRELRISKVEQELARNSGKPEIVAHCSLLCRRRTRQLGNLTSASALRNQPEN